MSILRFLSSFFRPEPLTVPERFPIRLQADCPVCGSPSKVHAVDDYYFLECDLASCAVRGPRALSLRDAVTAMQRLYVRFE